MTYRRLIHNNATFLSLFLIFFIFGTTYSCIFSDKAMTHLLFNSFHTYPLDIIMKYYTIIGEWVPYVIVFILLFYKLGWSLFLLADVALSGLVTQILKHLINASRPFSWFATHYPDTTLPLVDGVTLSQHFSFPSGHSTTFFAMFFVLSIIVTTHINTTPNISRKHSTISHTFQVLFILLALLGGYSRIYLSQHFFEDILGGSFVGILTTLCLLTCIPKCINKDLWHFNLKNAKKYSKNLHD